eukprot:TRINITY_DN9707_c0_g1_i5.p1 TRINITY_DN9707_c0_g1~~TRINITY_DN9707_c0_g1_i5.p1  ORF type:complete len:165 (-),score=23.41 TRINITY_DN9707_c0_g1_i5:40-534(-)
MSRRNKTSSPKDSKSEDNDPKTLNESDQKCYLSFRNGGKLPPEAKAADFRRVKTHRVPSASPSEACPHFLKRTDRTAAEQVCRICLDAEANAVLMDCGHGAICFDCGLTLLKTTCECHLCRQPLIQLLRIEADKSEMLRVVEAVDLNNMREYCRNVMEIINLCR